jgi:hypothetical protein
LTGNYTTPKSGKHAGQLGPWAQVVSAIGLDPRSIPVRCAHVVLGLGWLAAALAMAAKPALGWWIALCCGVASLWYLPIGTILSIATIVILMAPPLRSLR